jgi:hypothetical protein
MRKLLLFVLLVVSTNLFSQIPDSLEVTLPWDIIYVADCHSDVGAVPTTTNEGVYISAPEITLVVEDENGDCYKKLITYTILDWHGNATYTFTQIMKVDEMYTLNTVSDMSISYDELPFQLTASDLVVDADPTHIYSFDPYDASATTISYDLSDIFGHSYTVYVYDHTDQSVSDVNVVISDCEEDVIIDVPASFTVEFTGESHIMLTEELFDMNIVYPCAEYELEISHGFSNRIYSSSIGETIEIKVFVYIDGSLPFITYTEYITVTVIGEGPVPIPMYIEEKTFMAGEEITLDVWSDQLDDLIAWQFRLNFQNATIIGITEGTPFENIPNNIFNEDKTVNSLWTPADAQAIDVVSNETWFTLTILPSIDGSTFDIFTTENDPWSSIFIDEEGSIIDVEVDFSFQIEERNFLVSNVDLKENNLRIHNNPVIDRLVLSGFEHENKDSQFSIFNLEGKQMFSKSVDTNASNVELDVSTLQSGIYILVIEGVKSKPIKFIKI